MLGFSAGSSFLIHKTVLGASVTANVLVDLTNESRLAFNESPLVRSQLLDQAATLKAEDMATERYFAHNSPKGITPWHWFQEVGYTFLFAGENLAINFLDANNVRDAWLASPTHRANLLDVRFKEIGMATVSGVYKDGPTIYVVQLFGTPAVAMAQTAEATTTPVITSSETKIKTSTTTSEEPSKGSTALALNAPEIKGETVDTKPVLEPVFTTQELAVVKNTEVVEIPPEAGDTAPVTYSRWYERALFGGSYYVDILLKVLLVLVAIGLLFALFIEVRRQHWKHIAFGLALVLIITLSIIINQTFW
jgi:hypothetical protein